MRGRSLPQMLGANLDDLRLLHLTQINERFKILRLPVFAQHVSQNAFVAAVIFLMRLHDGRMNVEILWLAGERCE